MITVLNKSSLWPSAYLCVNGYFNAEVAKIRRGPQRKPTHRRARWAADPDPFPPDVKLRA
jgi:hypothetical protein